MKFEHTTPARATRALDAQRVNGFCVDLAGGFYVTHPTPRMWMLFHPERSQSINDPLAWGTPTEVIAAWSRLHSEATRASNHNQERGASATLS
jgi:hypothetical protein